MQLVDLVNNKQLFSQKIQENAIDDIEKIGLEIVNLNVQNCTDDNDVIVNLGVDAAKLEAEGIKAKLEAKAAGKKAILLAEADGIKAKALAEAEGIEKKQKLERK